MKKSDLKTGMWVDTEIGRSAMVLLDTCRGNVIMYEDGFDNLDSWNESLECSDYGFYSTNDIIRVYEFDCTFKKGKQIIWDRQENKTANTANAANNIVINVTVTNDTNIKDIVKKIQDELSKVGI